jgi:hypothetical protein
MTVLVVARQPAVIDRIVPLLRAAGIDANGTASEDDAVTRLAAGDITALVIGGGVADAARKLLHSAAECAEVPVVEGALHGHDPEAYVRDELLPALRRLTLGGDPP